MEKIFFRVYIYISSSFELPGRCSFFSSLILRRGQAVLLLELPGEGARAGERQQIGQRGDGRRIVVQSIAGVVQFLCADVLGGAKAGFLKKQCGQMIGRKIDQLGQFRQADGLVDVQQDILAALLDLLAAGLQPPVLHDLAVFPERAEG